MVPTLYRSIRRRRRSPASTVRASDRQLAVGLPAEGDGDRPALLLQPGDAAVEIQGSAGPIQRVRGSPGGSAGSVFGGTTNESTASFDFAAPRFSNAKRGVAVTSAYEANQGFASTDALALHH